MIASLVMLSASPVIAATEPASKCVTTTTKASHASNQARLEKDVAPYASKEAAAKAIATYRNDLDTAWDAMNEPYCGAGIYGISPFIKSYTKSVDRARSAFLAAVAKLPKDSAATPAVAVTEKAPEPTPSPEAEKPAPIAEKAKVETSTKARYLSNLIRGMRSDWVTQLQKDLTKHFGIEPNDSNVTGYFGPKTQELVIKFQLEQKVISKESDAGAGMVGPKTRNALNAL